MSTDPFEAELRARLADLADREDDWDDPAPAAREIAAAGIAPDDDPAILTPAPPVRERRRWLPGLAVAAVVLALVVGGGLGIRELARGGSSSSAGSSAGFAAENGDAAGAPSSTAPQAPGPASGGTGSAAPDPTTSRAGGEIGPGDTAGCQILGAATSTGPLAAIASIRPSGITGARATSGGSAGISYQLTFAEAGGTAQVRPARATWVVAGQLCAATGTATTGVVQALPVEPGGGVSGSATFAAVDSRGEPLPAGEYTAVIVIPYSVGGQAVSQLVSAPVTVTVMP